MNGLGRSVNEQLAFLADYKETACVFAGAEENEKKRNR